MWVHGRHSVLSRNAFFPLHLPFSVTSSITQLVSEEANNFAAWLQSRGEKEACESATMGISTHGRALFATKPIKAGEHILKISKHLIITPDRLHDEVKDLLHKNVSSCAQLALLILAEQYAGQASDWAPYMRCLPHIGSLNNTVLWSDKELGMLKCSSRAYQLSLRSRATIVEEFAAVNNKSYSLVCMIVNSRAWWIDDLNTVGLLPFVDFLNHDASCKSFLSFNQENDNAEVVADRDYAPGEEVLVNYGKFGNEVLAETFGFTLEDNPYDQVEVWMGLFDEDVLRKEKLQLLCAHGMLSLTDIGNSVSGGNIFVLKEVKCVRGRGRGIPQSIRAFARVLSASSKEELVEMANETSKLDGRLARQPLKDTCKEFGAMQVLLARIKSQIQEHMDGLLVLEVENSCRNNPRMAIRKKMAKDILSGELRVLCTVADWLKHYCDGLNSHTKDE